MGWSFYQYPPGSGGGGRYYWKANGASYGQIVPAELDATNSSLEMDVYVIDGDDQEFLFSYEYDLYFKGRFRFTSGKAVFELLVGDGSTWPVNTTGSITVSNYEKVNLKVEFSGGYVTSYINGNEDIVKVSAGTVPIVSCVAMDAAFSNFPLNGFITSLSITGITNTDAYPTGSAHWKMDTDASKDGYVFAESDNEFGELVDNDNPYSVGDQWSYLGDGKWQLDGDGSLSTLWLVYSAEQGFDKVVSFTVAELSGELVYSTDGSSVDSEGDYEFTMASDVSQQFKRKSGVVSCVISNVSIKQTTAIQLYSAVPDDFYTELPTPPPSERYYWYNDGTGYGSITPAETSQATLFETQCVVLSYGVYQRFFGSEDYLLSCDTGVDNSTFRLVNCNAWLDDVPIVSAVTPLPDVNEQFNLKVQPLASYTVDTLFGLAQDGKIINSIMWDTSITGIQNTDDYPAGEETWLCDTDASKDGYIYYGSTSGTEAILTNATAGQFLTYLPEVDNGNVTINGLDLEINGEAVQLELDDEQ